jgi:hypothetical protein
VLQVAAGPDAEWVRHGYVAAAKDEKGPQTPQPFSTFTLEYENKDENGKTGHENERELTEY